MNSTLKKSCAILLACAPFCLAVAATEDQDLFHTSPDIPAGFMSLSAAKITMVDLYYQGKLLGVFKAKVTPDYVEFANVNDLMINFFGKLKDPEVVKKVLSGKLPTNASQVCDVIKRAGCGAINPEIAGIIYNQQIFRASLFINPSYLLDNIKPLLTPIGKSSSDFSYINQLYAVSSNSAGANKYNDYNLTTNNTWAYKNTDLYLSTSYANNLNNEKSTDDLVINDLHASMVSGKYKYTTGMFDTVGNNFLTNQSIVGADVRTTLATIPGALNGVGTPVTVSLDFPSQVSIYRDGYLVYTGQYPAGNQIVDTSTLPTGAYNILIKISNTFAPTREINQFYIKTLELAPQHMPQYYFSAGYLLGNNPVDPYQASNLFNVPIYQTGFSMRLKPKFGMDGGIYGTDKNLFTNVGGIYIVHNINEHPSLLVSVLGDVGYANTLSLSLKKFSLYANVSQVWYRNSSDNIDSNLVTNNCFLSSLQANASATYQMKDSALSAFGDVSKACSNDKNYNYGLTYNREMSYFKNHTSYFRVSLSRYDHSILSLLSFTMNFGSGPTTGYVGTNYGMGDTQGLDNVASLNGGINFSRLNAVERGYNLNMNTSLGQSLQSGGANYTYQNDSMRLNSYGNYAGSAGKNNTEAYGGSLSSNLVYAKHKVTVGGYNTDPNSGVVVDVISKDKKDTFDVYANDHLREHVKANKKYFIPLLPFNNYNIRVENASAGLRNFADKNRQVTIYPGNVQLLTYHVVQTKVIIGRLLDTSGKPITNSAILGVIGYSDTDDDGYFQLETKENIHKFYVTTKNSCAFQVSVDHQHQNYSYVGNVVCRPIKLSEAKHVEQ
jgi:hypothetical protein